MSDIDWKEVARNLEFALRGLYDDQVDYLTLNNLGGLDNHWMRATRIALVAYEDALNPPQAETPAQPWPHTPECRKSPEGSMGGAFNCSCGAETASKPDDPNAPFRWICIHCNTVSGIDDRICLGCRKPRYPTSDRGEKR